MLVPVAAACVGLSGIGCAPADDEPASVSSAVKPGRVLNITVKDTRDGGKRSLRAAIAKANLVSGRYASVAIELGSGTYELTQCGDDDSNAAGDLDLTGAQAVTITSRSGSVIRQICSGDRVLDEHGTGLLTLENVTITGGSLAVADPTRAAEGGGVRAAGDVRLVRATVTGNSATGANAVTLSDGTFTAAGSARGAGLFVGGSLQSSDATISSNSVIGGAGLSVQPGGDAAGAGAYVLGGIEIVGGEISDNHATGGRGGDAPTRPGSGGAAIGAGLAQDSASSAATMLSGVILNRNEVAAGAWGTGGSPTTPVTQAPSRPAQGGALSASGTLTVQNVTAIDNRAFGGGNSDSCYGCAPGAAQGSVIASAASANISGSYFEHNHALSGSVIMCQQLPWVPGCSGYFCYTFPSAPCCSQPPPIQCGTIPAFPGGGVITSVGSLRTAQNRYVGNISRVTLIGDADVAMTNDVFDEYVNGGVSSQTDATIVATKIRAGSDAPAAQTVGRLALTDSELSNESSGGPLVQADTLDARNVTMTSDFVTNPTQSPTLLLLGVAASRLVNTTMTGTDTAIQAQALELEQSTIVNSGDAVSYVLDVPALTTHRSVVLTSGFAICSDRTAVVTSSYNWFGDASCHLLGTGDQQGSADFRLGALADNGGAVQTLAPELGSVLIDRIPAGSCPIPSDARGVARPQGAACDIGAVEVQP